MGQSGKVLDHRLSQPFALWNKAAMFHERVGGHIQSQVSVQRTDANLGHPSWSTRHP
jgi:hypothetical protein